MNLSTPTPTGLLRDALSVLLVFPWDKHLQVHLSFKGYTFFRQKLSLLHMQEQELFSYYCFETMNDLTNTQFSLYYHFFFISLFFILMSSLVLFFIRRYRGKAFFAYLTLSILLIWLFFLNFDLSTSALSFTLGNENKGLYFATSQLYDGIVLSYSEEVCLIKNIELWYLRRFFDLLIFASSVKTLITQMKRGIISSFLEKATNSLIGSAFIHGHGSLYATILEEKAKEASSEGPKESALQLKKEKLPILLQAGGLFGTGAGYSKQINPRSCLVNAADAAAVLNYQEIKKKNHKLYPEEILALLYKEKPKLFDNSECLLAALARLNTKEIAFLKRDILNKKNAEPFAIDNKVANLPAFKGDLHLYEGPIHPRQYNNINLLFQRQFMKSNEVRHLEIIQENSPNKICVFVNNNKIFQHKRIDAFRYNENDWRFVEKHPFDIHEALKNYPHIKQEGLDIKKSYNTADYEEYIRCIVNNDIKGKLDLFEAMIMRFFSENQKLSPEKLDCFFDQQGAENLVITECFNFANENDRQLYLNIFETVKDAELPLCYQTKYIRLEVFSDIFFRKQLAPIEASSFDPTKDFKSQISSTTFKLLTDVEALLQHSSFF